MYAADYIVVGSGLTGATIARTLADAGREVLVVERRQHVGGNVHDTVHSSGVRVSAYGPHYFRTASDRVWDFVRQFGRFHRYEARVLTKIEDRYESWPLTEECIRRHAGDDWKPSFTGVPSNFEEAALSLMPRVIFHKFVAPYTRKQWGVSCRQLAADLCRRFDVRKNGETRLTPNAKYQGIPAEGYAVWMSRMLKGIRIVHHDYLQCREAFQAKKLLVFTGPIDEFFGFDLGKLKYRGQRREHEWINRPGYQQPCGQVNNPGDGKHVRTIEWKHMMEHPDECKGTVLTTETPFSPDDPDQYEYPFPDAANRMICCEYRKRAESLDKVMMAGRLGLGKYLDMDQAIGAALNQADRILAA